jgi:hypothetical protein
MAQPQRRPARGATPAPTPTPPRLRPAGTEDHLDLAAEIARRIGRHSGANEVEISARVKYRQPHDMLGTDGYSLVSNYFARRVLPYCLMHKIISPLQTAVLSNFIGRQNRGLITATQEEIAKEIGVARTSVGAAIDRLCLLNLVRQERRSTYELNPTVAFNGNGDEQNAFLDELKALRLESKFPELAPEMTLFPVSGTA